MDWSLLGRFSFWNSQQCNFEPKGRHAAIQQKPILWRWRYHLLQRGARTRYRKTIAIKGQINYIFILFYQSNAPPYIPTFLPYKYGLLWLTMVIETLYSPPLLLMGLHLLLSLYPTILKANSIFTNNGCAPGQMVAGEPNCSNVTPLLEDF